MARTKDPKIERQRRIQVLDATISLLEEGSWKGTSLAAVAKRAGVSKGVVTYWFTDKEALILAAIERYHLGWTEKMATVVMSGKSVSGRLDDLLLVAFPSAEEVRKEIRFQAEVLSFSKSRIEAEEQIRQSYAGFRMVTKALIMLGMEEGYITRPTENLARFVHALIDGLSFQVAADPQCDLPGLRRDLKIHLERWFQ